MKTFRVWYIPQIPGEPLYIPVDNLNEARIVGNTLAALSMFEYAQGVKPDYSDAMGLEVYENGEWNEYSDDAGDEFSF